MTSSWIDVYCSRVHCYCVSNPAVTFRFASPCRADSASSLVLFVDFVEHYKVLTSLCLRLHLQDPIILWRRIRPCSVPMSHNITSSCGCVFKITIHTLAESSHNETFTYGCILTQSDTCTLTWHDVALWQRSCSVSYKSSRGCAFTW